MSHEIRTPMNGVMGMTELLQRSELTDKQRGYTEIIQSSARSLLTVINDILDFSKIEAGKLDLEQRDFDLRAIIEDTTANLAETARGKGLDYNLDIDTGLVRTVRGDSSRIGQILTNLIGNAIKFTETGEVLVRVKQGEINEGEVKVCFEVQDTGIGILPHQVKHIFDSFNQADSTTTRKFGGTGLGLAIAKQLVEMMGGEIGVESRRTQGSIFWFSVRLQHIPTVDGELLATLQDIVAMRVLVVDDNQTNRRILQEQLLAWKLDPTLVSSGAEAIGALHSAVARGNPFSLVILDQDMPNLSGTDVARAVRETKSLRKVPLIMMSSVGQLEQDDIVDPPIDCFIIKPVRQEKLLECIRRLSTPGVMQERPLETPVELPDSDTPLLGLRVLMAEDNPVNQLVGQEVLELLGCQVDMVEDGEAAVERFEEGEFDIVLMDCQLPRMDGYEATEKIRAFENRHKRTATPIIALTAYAMKGDREKALESGMDDHLGKPYSREELETVLRRWTEPQTETPARQAAH
ncbi:MAG: response regulator, partial [Chromatiales bacterium]|nr:response regulator [Chromatiales bacterium]